LSGGFFESILDPSLKMSWDLYDSGPVSGPGSATVATDETTTSTSYVDLATTTDQVTVNVGNSGMVIVFVQSQMYNATTNDINWLSFALSGANTASAADSKAMFYESYAPASVHQSGMPFLVTGLVAGATTFKLKYRVNSGTGHFLNRAIAVIPL
jgi:hypothetical protein